MTKYYVIGVILHSLCTGLYFGDNKFSLLVKSQFSTLESALWARKEDCSCQLLFQTPEHPNSDYCVRYQSDIQVMT